MIKMQSRKNIGSNGAFAGLHYQPLVGGITGGVTSTLILHPLDLLKVRFAGEFLTF